MAVFLVIVTMHIYAERFLPQVLLEKRGGHSDSGAFEPTKSAGGWIRATFRSRPLYIASQVQPIR